MNKFFVAVILLLSFTTCAFAQVVEDSQFNANLTKSEDVRWIDDDFYYLHSVGVKQQCIQYQSYTMVQFMIYLKIIISR
ncbi:MAG: hypothetical protein PHE45_07090, partial [Bacteroidales bacterium]|nr:hypothetical protein [Bacteroidales bacterium]